MNVVIEQEGVEAVQKLARQFVRRLPQGCDEGAIEGAALESLARSAERYEPSVGGSFSGYAKRMAWYAMQDEVRVITGNSRAAWQAHKRGEQAEGFFSEHSMSAAVGEDGLTVADRVSDERGFDHDEVIDLRAAVAELPERERFVLVGKACGLKDREIAAQLGVTECRVSQLKKAGRARLAGEKPAVSTQGASLSAAEGEVLRLLASGLSTAQVAASRSTSLHTVNRQIKSARQKLGAHSLAHAVAVAWRQTDVFAAEKLALDDDHAEIAV